MTVLDVFCMTRFFIEITLFYNWTIQFDSKSSALIALALFLLIFTPSMVNSKRKLLVFYILVTDKLDFFYFNFLSRQF